MCHFTVITQSYVLQQKRCCLTVESQIAKYGSEEVHDEHAQDGNIANILHSPLGWALGEKDT